MSPSKGVRALMRSKSSMSSGTSASRAMASMCSTILVEPPVVALGGVRGRRDRRSHRREPAELERHGHGVGGELTAARAGARTREVLDRLQLLVGDLARGVGADRLEDVLDRQV